MLGKEKNLGQKWMGGFAAIGDQASRALWFLDADGLCASARQRTGLASFGDPPVDPALSILTDSLEREADLHPLGRFLMRMHLRGLLETRLRLTELWRGRERDLLSTPVRRPIFITGMPRSGSTFLHELLSEDPGNRAPRVWEVMFPVADAQSDARKQDSRIKKAEDCLWWFRKLAPEADSVYPMRALTPHECVAIQSHAFLSEEFVSTCRVPTYESFLRSADLLPAYVWQKKFLQHLHWGQPHRRWVLKSPDHVHGLESLFSVFPDAVVVQTHRNPLEVLKSSCRLTSVLQGLYSRPGNLEHLAIRETNVLAQALNRVISFRDAHPEFADRFVDVAYGDVASNPIAVVRRIYEKFDLTLTDEAARRMQSLAGRRSRYEKRGPASGASPVKAHADASRFERYCSRFNVTLQQPAA
jgi:hypothetical protein